MRDIRRFACHTRNSLIDESAEAMSSVNEERSFNSDSEFDREERFVFEVTSTGSDFSSPILYYQCLLLI